MDMLREAVAGSSTAPTCLYLPPRGQEGLRRPGEELLRKKAESLDLNNRWKLVLVLRTETLSERENAMPYFSCRKKDMMMMIFLVYMYSCTQSAKGSSLYQEDISDS